MAFLVLVLWAGKQGEGRGKRPRKEAEEQGRPYPGKRVLNPQLEVDIPAYLIIKFKNFCVKLRCEVSVGVVSCAGRSRGLLSKLRD